MRRIPLILISLCITVLLLSLSACGEDWFQLPTATPTQPTATASNTLIPTETRVWFPPTETNTPVQGEVKNTPTPDLRPLENEIILTDDFSDESNWEQFSTVAMVAAYGVDELTLALKEEKDSLYSFNHNEMPNNYYLEMMIEPSLCTGSDQYGVVFRTQSRYDFYRLTMSCDGHIRLDLVKGGSAIRLIETEQSAQIFSGPYAKVKLSLWVVGDGVKVFINDVLQVEYYSMQWYVGGLGVFARSNGEYALTVSFSDLSMRIANPLPATLIPSLTPTPD